MGVQAYKNMERSRFTYHTDVVHQNQVNFIIAESLFWEKNMKAFKKLLMKPFAIIKKVNAIPKLVKMAVKPNTLN